MAEPRGGFIPTVLREQSLAFPDGHASQPGIRIGGARNLQRLRARETMRFGAAAVAAGGWRHKETEEFIEWASWYDDKASASRSLAKHEAWLAALPCPVLRLDGSQPLPKLVAEVSRAIDA